VRPASDEGLHLAVVTQMKLGQQITVESVGAVHVSMHTISPGTGLWIEAIEAGSEQVPHGFEPGVERTVRHDVTASGKPGIERLVTEWNRVVEKGVVPSQEIQVDLIE